ncbi:UNVERIFIED_CONTAM: putative inactive receptor kinase [Sesamum radiatum]|uniref:Inactive receptor kinase n=1 Tax=Sesamum radiatum TaxID=300843 RepID=A0AAW2JJ12_SESRA
MKLWFKLAAVTCLFLLLAVFLQPVNCDLNTDARALLDFAAAVPHVRKLNWEATNSICSSWIGITCTKDRARVNGIHLPAFGLYGPIPADTIGKLDALRVLSLRSNHLNGKLPSDILSIPSLQSVFLQNNNFSGVIPVSLSPRLSIIDLSFNSFTGEIPSSVESLKRLTVLNLQFNSLSGGVPNLDVPRLELLNLSHNLFEWLDSILAAEVSGFFVHRKHSFMRPPLLRVISFSTPGSSSSTAISHSNSRKLSLGAIIAIAIGSASLLVLLFLAILFRCMKKGGGTLIIAKASTGGKNENLKSEDFGSGVQGAEKNKLVFFEGCSFSFDLEDLLRASAEGKGSYGTAYKAILDECNNSRSETTEGSWDWKEGIRTTNGDCEQSWLAS